MKTNRALGSKRSSMLTLAGIVSLSIVSYSACYYVDITNTTAFPAKYQIHGSNITGMNCTLDKGDLKPGETRRNDNKFCMYQKISAVIDTGRNNTWSATAAEYTAKSNPKASQIQGEFLERGGAKFRIVKDAKYNATGGFGVEKI